MKPYRVLIAPDKFKGTLTAPEAAAAIARGLATHWPDVETICLPIADGGEGTTEALLAGNRSGERVGVATLDALLRPREAVVAHFGDDAVFECADAVGLRHIDIAQRDPWRASTRGVGVLLRAAVAGGATRIMVGLGGSATNDAGLGMAAELGWKFLDLEGRPVEPVPVNFPLIAHIEAPARPLAARVIGLCDVTNPLLGEAGASRVYGPQKGLSDPLHMDEAMAGIADVIARCIGRDFRDAPGAGAAGGLGFGLMMFASATLEPGFETIAELIGIEAAVRTADLVITGEGKIDRQTFFGKGPAELARLARRHGKHVIAFCGVLESGANDGTLFDEVIPLVTAEVSLAAALEAPALRLSAAATEFAAKFLR